MFIVKGKITCKHKNRRKKMFEFNSGLITRARTKLGLRYIDLSNLTKTIDPEGAGVSEMTCRRIEEFAGYSPNVRSIILISEALQISPRSLLVKKNSEKE